MPIGPGKRANNLEREIMSYSFTVKAASKAEAKEKVAAEFASVLQNQSIHAVDLGHAATAADAFLDLLDDSEADGKDVILSVHGSVGWSGDYDAPRFTQASVGVSAYYVLRPVA